MNKILFTFLVLVPFVAFGHIRNFFGVPFSFFFYAIAYFIIGYLQKRYFQGRVYYVITILSIILYNIHLINEAFNYFPSHVPTLIFIGFISYFLGLNFQDFKLKKVVLYSGGISLFIIIWTYFIIPHITYNQFVNSAKYNYLLEEKVDLKFKTLDGKIISEDFFKDKVVVLDFWFSRCGYCFEKFPLFDQIYSHYKGNQNIVIATVVPGGIDAIEDIKNVLKDYPLETPVLYDSASVFIKKYNIAKYGYPFEIRIDKNGLIKQTVIGSHGSKKVRSVYIKESIKDIDEYL